MLKLHVLASGSRGNAAIVENDATGHGVLIDCGISKRDFMARCEQAGFDPTLIDAILITHEHTDHTKGLGVVLRGLAKLGAHPDVYADPATARASKPVQEAAATHRIATFGMNGAKDARAHASAGGSPLDRTTGAGASADLELAGMRIFPFATSHDAAASCGFRIECDRDALGFMTDTGIVMPAAHDCLKDVRLLALECNHDARMLERGPYPYSVKQRIASDCGHLSNDQASEELASLLSDRLESTIALHVSENNNEYDIALKTFRETLAREGHEARVFCGYQGRLTSIG